MVIVSTIQGCGSNGHTISQAFILHVPTLNRPSIKGTVERENGALSTHFSSRYRQSIV